MSFLDLGSFQLSFLIKFTTMADDHNMCCKKVCVLCFQWFDVVSDHYRCGSSKRAKVDNITNLLEKTPTSSQRACSRIISKMETPFLSTLGNKPQQIKIKKEATKKQLFSLDDLSSRS